MNYTTNYHLPQWDETDRIMRTDFNQMCADIESGLTKTASDAASATSAASAVAAQAAQKAQSTADKAVQDAARAQAKADAAYAPDQPPYVVGTYTGTGIAQSIEVGFRPRFLIIHGGTVDSLLATGPDTKCSSHLSFTDTGFTVKVAYTGSGQMQQEVTPRLSRPDAVYNYLAFR